jgi:peptidoglycan/LPS O-acetylase OafA/YrhL
MDKLRAFTIFLVVILHVAMFYSEFSPIKNNVPEAYYPVFMVILGILSGPTLNAIMFFIAGFFALSTFQERGVFPFFKDKLKRLGIPYITGFIFLAPLAQYITVISFGSDINYFHYWFKEFFLPGKTTPHHLWFIGILLILFIVSMPIFSVLMRVKITFPQRRYIQIIIVLLFLAAVFLLTFILGFVFEPFYFIDLYIIDFQAVVIPIYAYFFLGVYASLQNWFSPERKNKIYPWAIMYAIGVFLYIGTLALIPNAMETNHPLLPFGLTIMTYGAVMLMITVFKRFANRISKLWLMISRNSYGAYILHYLIVSLTVYVMRDILNFS